MVQRLLAARNLRDARVALLAAAAAWCWCSSRWFLVIGAGLFVFYGQHPAALTVKGSDRLFPAFIVQQMPVGIAGAADCGYSGGSHVQSFCRAELAFFHHHCGFLTCVCGPAQRISGVTFSRAWPLSDGHLYW